MSSEEDSSSGSSYTESETDTGSTMTTETETDTISDSTETDSETGSDSETDSTDYTDDSDEKASQRAAKKGGVSSDPFKRRVPQSFYDNEKRRFGPLDSEWEVAYHNKKPYFVNHKTKQTTWIDPRSIETRVSDPQKCQMGQLPYGWDEEIDSEIGVYYIDHTTQSTYLDPPWDPRVKFQVAQLKKFIQQQVQLAQMQLADGRINDEDIAGSKKELMDEIERLKQKSKEISEDSDSDSDLSDLSEDSEPPKTLEEFQERLQTLMQLATTLQNSGQNEVDDAKRANVELERVQKMLEEEEKIRRKLQEDLEELKKSINQPYDRDDDDNYSREESPAHSEDSATLNPGEPDFKIKKKPNLSRRTRLEMETEILVLKKRIQEEKTKQKKLEELKQMSENPVQDREGARPTWIKQLEDVASSSKTLRVKIAMKQQQGPDQLSFRERMLFFAAGAAGGKK